MPYEFTEKEIKRVSGKVIKERVTIRLYPDMVRTIKIQAGIENRNFNNMIERMISTYKG